MPQSSRFKDSRLEISHWHDLTRAFGMCENNETYEALILAYCEKHRAYHTLDHIAACFRHLDNVVGQAEYPHEIELALWFHDAIYKPFSGSNEEDSAELARSFLVKNNVTSEAIARICELIIMTKEHVAPSTIDGKLMLDIDLSILGADEHIYAQFEKDVRKEYKRVPSFIFKKKRKAVLQSFLNRSKLYQTEYFSVRLEAQAKTNLAWAIGEL